MPPVLSALSRLHRRPPATSPALFLLPLLVATLAELQHRRSLTPNVAVYLRSSLRLLPRPNATGAAFFPIGVDPLPSSVALDLFFHQHLLLNAAEVVDAVDYYLLVGFILSFSSPVIAIDLLFISVIADRRCIPPPMTPSLPPSQLAVAAINLGLYSSVSFSTPQRPSHRHLLSLFPEGLFSVSPPSTPRIVDRLLLLRRRSLLPPWPRSRRLPPLVPPSRANASSIAASQSSVDLIVAYTRRSLRSFSFLSHSPLPQLHDKPFPCSELLGWDEEGDMFS